MTFRLRIFLLVMLVAVTAIAATAWLTLSLTSRQLARGERAQEQHERRIARTIEDYGIRNGRWNGVDRVVAELSKETDLHVQLVSTDGERIADSDNIEGRPAGPVQSRAKRVQALPALDPAIALAISRPGVLPLSRPDYAEITRDLFDPAVMPSDPRARFVRQAAQYRAALATVRCVPGYTDGIASTSPPYLSNHQLTTYADCARAAVVKVSGDREWLTYIWQLVHHCATTLAREVPATCAGSMFPEAAGSASGIAPVDVYLGAHTGVNSFDEVSREAMLGAAGLIVVALLGTALIARRVSRPVQRLTMASFLLAGGNLDVRVSTPGRDELAQLSASFNAMAEAVQRSEERQRRLIADVAHEMRTPLSNLRGYLEGLSDGVVEPSRELFASLHEETLLQGRILDDLQVLALAESGALGYDRAPLDLAELVTAACTAHRAVAAEQGVTLTVTAPDSVWVHADPDRIRQVLGNLLSNAVRYTDSGGSVEVRVGSAGGEALLTVKDTGMGMTPYDMARVFDRFWRADPARQRATGGSGLGMTIAQRIVSDHGGRIEVSSQPGRGTEFTVRLPLQGPVLPV